MTLLPEFAEYLQLRAKMNIPLPWETSIQEFRKMTLPNPNFIGIPEDIHSVEHRVISGPTSYLPIRIYRPNTKSNLPAMVYFHGGGWVIGNMDGFEPTVRSLANKGEIIIIQVQYQKAPERPFPIPFDDCYRTLEWIVENAEILGIDKSKMEALQTTLMKIRQENIEKDKLIQQYEKTIQDIQSIGEKKAIYLKGSNLDKTL